MNCLVELVGLGLRLLFFFLVDLVDGLLRTEAFVEAEAAVKALFQVRQLRTPRLRVPTAPRSARLLLLAVRLRVVVAPRRAPAGTLVNLQYFRDARKFREKHQKQKWG